MATQYECPKCGEVYLTEGWCPNDNEKLEAVLVEHVFPLATEPLHFDPEDPDSYDRWVDDMIKDKNKKK